MGDVKAEGKLGSAAREMQVPVEHLLLSPPSAPKPPTEAPEVMRQRALGACWLHRPPGRLLLLRSVPVFTGEEIHRLLTRVYV